LKPGGRGQVQPVKGGHRIGGQAIDRRQHVLGSVRDAQSQALGDEITEPSGLLEGELIPKNRLIEPKTSPAKLRIRAVSQLNLSLMPFQSPVIRLSPMSLIR
jgi:hypothetical protein